MERIGRRKREELEKKAEENILHFLISLKVQLIAQLEIHSNINQSSPLYVQSVEVWSCFSLKFTLEDGQEIETADCRPSTVKLSKPPCPPPTTRSPRGGCLHHKHHLDHSTHTT